MPNEQLTKILTEETDETAQKIKAALFKEYLTEAREIANTIDLTEEPQPSTSTTYPPGFKRPLHETQSAEPVKKIPYIDPNKRRRRKYAIIRALYQREKKNTSDIRPFVHCYRCGDLSHKATYIDCPAKNHQCKKCEITGHYEFLCKNPRQTIVDLDSAENEFLEMTDEELLNHVLDLEEELLPRIKAESVDQIWDENGKEYPNIEAYLKETETTNEWLSKEKQILMNAIEKERNPPSKYIEPGIVISDAGDGLWTFVYRGPPPQFKNYKGDIIIIDHFDHYHFVFKSIQRNRRRAIERIFQGGEMDKDQLLTAIKTCIPVINWNKFAPYLVRHNNKVYLHGRKLEPLYIDLLNIPNENKNCADLNRELRRNDKPNTLMRRQRTDKIMDMVRLHDARTLNEFENNLTTSERLDLYNDFGNQWLEVTKLCIKVYNEEMVIDQTKTKYEDYIGHHDSCQYPSDYNATNKWFDNLFYQNDINPKEFCNAVSMVMNKTIARKNTLCIEGPTTTGKSLILKLICSEYNYGTVQRSGDQSQFFLQNLIKKTVALMEEPRITPITVNDFKQLLGGEPFDIHVKHQEDTRLNRIPVLISTNHNLGYYVCSTDRDAINMRAWTFKFTCQIGTVIPEPPCTLCSCHWRHWYGIQTG